MAMGMFGTILFIPLFIQGVIGTTATQSGTVLMPMMIVMIVSSIVGGQIISRTGRYKMIGVFGMCLMTVGLFLLSGMGPETDYLTVVRNMMIVGLGMGPTMPVFTLAAQNAVKMSQLGVVTALTQFSRSIGSTLGVAIFGSLLTNRFAPSFQAALPPEVKAVLGPERLAQFQNPQALLNPQAAQAMRDQLLALGPQGAQLFDALFTAIKLALVTGLHDVFLLGSILGAIGLVTVLFLQELPLRKSYAPTAADESAAQVGDKTEPSLQPLRRDEHSPGKPPVPLPVASSERDRAAG
jgi:MFS family permease